MSTDGQRTKWRKTAENFNSLSRAHERYRQTDRQHTTDGRTTTYSEREFTFAKIPQTRKLKYAINIEERAIWNLTRSLSGRETDVICINYIASS